MTLARGQSLRTVTLVNSWQTMATGVPFFAGLLGAFLKWGFTPFRRLASKIRSRKRAPEGAPDPQLPTEAPLRFVTDDRASFWGPAKKGELPGTAVAGHWTVTNVSNRDFVLLKARLEGYEAKHSYVSTKGFDTEAVGSTYDSRNPCAAGSMSRVMANFEFFPEICKGTKPLVADVIFTDN